jgi:HlyD family secretion protein
MVVLAVAIAAGLWYTNQPRTATAAAVSTTTVTRGNITSTVSGSGTITANQSLDLTFESSGVVKQVLVKAGDSVKAGQTLATLDDQALQAAVTTAQANLDSAQAKLEQTQKGNATAEEIAAAQAALDSAQAVYTKTVAGASSTDVAAAQASVTSAQAAYTAAVSSAAAGDSTLRALKATLDEAEIALQQAQAAYDRVAWRSDVGMSSESKTLQTATIEYQKDLANYNAQLTTSGSDAQSKIASAKASLASAQKNLADLKVSSSDIASAKANLESAKSNLAKLTSAGTATDVAIAQASVTSAEQSLKQAQLNLENATLKAPFDGVISAVNIVPGSSVSSNAMTLINTDPLHIELKLSENNVTKAVVGQTVNLSSDALSDWKAQGTVSYVAPSGTTSNGVVTYLVRVDFKNTDTRIKVGMTSNVDIVIAQKDNVLLVPNAALLPQGNGQIVQILGANGARQSVQVKTGITDGTHTEIVSGVTEGQQIVALPTSTSGTSSNSNSAGGGGGRPGGGFLGIP